MRVRRKSRTAAGDQCTLLLCICMQWTLSMPGHVCFRTVHDTAHALHCMAVSECAAYHDTSSQDASLQIPPGCRMRGLLASALSTRDASTQYDAAAFGASVVSSGVQTMLVPADAQAGLQSTRQSHAGGDFVHKALFPVACIFFSRGTFAALCKQCGRGALCVL